MRVGAIAVRHRHKGGGYADEMFRDSLDLVTENAAAMEVREVTVVGHVWEANRPSQDLCRRHGFIHTGDGGKGVQQWTATFSTLLDE